MEVGKCWERVETHRKSLRPYIKMLVNAKDKKKKRRAEKIPSTNFADIRLGYSLGAPSTNSFLRRNKEAAAEACVGELGPRCAIDFGNSQVQSVR